MERAIHFVNAVGEAQNHTGSMEMCAGSAGGEKSRSEALDPPLVRIQVDENSMENTIMTCKKTPGLGGPVQFH